MQIVIDINDNEYLSVKNYPDNITSYPVTIHLYEAVRNGTPLPKGHGRLIDVDAISLADINFFSISDYRKIVRKLTDADAIIEADKDDN